MMSGQRGMGLGDAASHDGLQSLGRLGPLGELLPHPDNRVQFADENDRLGLPVAQVIFSLHDNDKKFIEFAKHKVMEVMWAAGANEVVQEARYAHLVGAARMGNDPATSV